MDNHLKIINASIDVICEQGIRGVTLESVAKEAELEVSEVISVFENKDKILDGLLIYINCKRNPRMDDLLSELSTKDMFLHQYLRWVRFLYEEDFFFTVLEALPGYYGEDCLSIMPAMTLKAALQKCREEQLVEGEDIDQQLKLINTRLMGFIRWIHGDSQVLFDVYLVSHVNAIWELIRKNG